MALIRGSQTSAPAPAVDADAAAESDSSHGQSAAAARATPSMRSVPPAAAGQERRPLRPSRRNPIPLQGGAAAVAGANPPFDVGPCWLEKVGPQRVAAPACACKGNPGSQRRVITCLVVAPSSLPLRLLRKGFPRPALSHSMLLALSLQRVCAGAVGQRCGQLAAIPGGRRCRGHDAAQLAPPAARHAHFACRLQCACSLRCCVSGRAAR